MSNTIVNEYNFKADSWSSFPGVVSVPMAKGARIIEFRNTGCNVTLFAMEYAFAEKEKREFHLYPLGKIFDSPSLDEFRILGIAGDATNKCIIYEKLARAHR